MLVSMNMWGVTPVFMDMLERGFVDFLANLDSDELKAEFLLPVYIGQLLDEKKVTVKVLQTPDQWFGITYKEDTHAVTEDFKGFYQQGIYANDLFEDLK